MKMGLGDGSLVGSTTKGQLGVQCERLSCAGFERKSGLIEDGFSRRGEGENSAALGGPGDGRSRRKNSSS